MNPSVAVVILNWNGSGFLKKFLPSVLKTNYGNLQVIVADNASTDDSVEVLQKEFPEVRIIQNKENSGFAGGYNEALQHVDAKYYVLLNSDVEVTPGWITPVIELMESDEKIAACQPKVLMYDKPTHFEYAGASGGFIDVFGYPFCRGRIFDTVEEDKGQYDDVREVFWATGACLFIKSELYHKFGGFDDLFFAHMEEIDLCWRMKNEGYKIMVCPQSVVYHVGGGSLPKESPHKAFLNFRNSLVMMQKNLPAHEAFVKIKIRFFLDFIVWLQSIAGGKAAISKAITKAHWQFLTKQGSWLKSRKKAGSKKPLRTHVGFYKGSIVKAYFLGKKNKFKDLGI